MKILNAAFTKRLNTPPVCNDARIINAYLSVTELFAVLFYNIIPAKTN